MGQILVLPDYLNNLMNVCSEEACLNMAIIALFSVLLGTTFAEFTSLPTEQTNHLINDYLTKFSKDNHIPCFVAGYQLYSTKNNTVVGQTRFEYTNGGWADVENDVKCTVNSVMRVASVSKAIGSGLVASLVETGKLNWDDDVHKYVPESVFPQKTWNGEKVTITLRELITHLSGLRTTSNEDLMHDWEFRITNSTQTVAFFAKDPLIAKPNTKFYYSNSGWNLIGAIVEAVEKRSYHLVLRDFMRSVGMKVAQMDTRLELVPNRAQHYYPSKDAQGKVHILPAPITDSLRPVPHWPCGGVITNIGDLITYGSEMLNSYNGRDTHHLKPATVHSMWNYKPPVNEGHLTMTIDGHRFSNISNRYALGWDRIDFPVESTDSSLSNLEMVFHVGAIGGSSAVVAVLPEKNLVVAAIANLGGVSDLLPTVAAQVYHILANGK